MGKLRPRVEVERNVQAWVGPQGSTGQALTGFGCSPLEQRPLSKCGGTQTGTVWGTESLGPPRPTFRFASDVYCLMSGRKDFSFLALVSLSVKWGDDTRKYIWLSSVCSTY